MKKIQLMIRNIILLGLSVTLIISCDTYHLFDAPSQQSNILSLTANPDTLSYEGGVVHINWKTESSNKFNLTVKPFDGVSINSLITGNKTFYDNTSTANVKLPVNPAHQPKVYTFILSAKRYISSFTASDSISVIVNQPKNPYSIVHVYSGSNYSFQSPGSISIDGSGNIWIANKNSSIIKLDSSGTLIGIYKDNVPISAGTGATMIDALGNIWIHYNGSNPYSQSIVVKLDNNGNVIGTYNMSFGIAGSCIDVSGQLWLAQFGYANVTKLNSDGSINKTYSEPSSGPTGIVADGSGNIWVAGYNTNDVTKMNSSGTIIGTFSTPTYPVDLAIDPSGNVWVVSPTNNNVTEISSSGNHLGTYALGTNPSTIAIDQSGKVWIVNKGSNNVMELNSSGSVMKTYYVGNTPSGIAIDKRGNVWVTNSGDNSVTEFLKAASGPQYFPYNGPFWPNSE